MESFTKQILLPGQKIFIYGAGTYGEIALRSLEQWGLHPTSFIDRRIEGKTYLGIQVLSPKIIQQHRNDIFLIASLNYFPEIKHTLENAEARYYYDITELLKVHIPEGLLSEHAIDSQQKFYLYEKMAKNVEKLIIPICDVTVTQKCTLQCKNCSYFIPYYQNPVDVELGTLVLAFNRFLHTVDRVCDMRIIGGEPFSCHNANLIKILTEYRENPKIDYITIYTNGTLFPKSEILKILQSPKIRVHISDYGIHSAHAMRYAELFRQKNIPVTVHHYEKWSDFGDVGKRDESLLELNLKAESCTLARTNNFYFGKFYSCARAAHGSHLGFMPSVEEDYVDFREEKIDYMEKRLALQKLLYGTKYLDACQYCGGANYQHAEIPAAEQIVSYK
jgi:organic radical activating enzyme